MPATIGQAQMLRAGLSYRQLDHWTTRGWLKVVGDAKPGTGNARSWLVGEDRVAGIMVRLTDAGIKPDVAEQIARGHHEIGPGIVVMVDGMDGTEQDDVMADLAARLGWG